MTSPSSESLVKGLRKAVADPETEWVDANIVRLLLDRYDEATAQSAPSCPHGDATCPCQDGDPCHYEALPGSPAWTTAPNAPSEGQP